MKQLLAIFTAALLWVPGLALAAYNDVLLETSGTVISVGGVSLNITGYASDLESIKTETDTFTVTLGSGSRFQVTSNDGYVMTHDAANALVQTDSCSGGVSTLEFVGTGSVTITTTTTECSGNASQSSPIGSGGVVSSGGGGGGGGGGSSSATVSRPQVSFPDGTVIYLDEADANAKIAAKNAELGITKTAATTKTVATTPSGTEVSVPVIATLFSRALDLGDKNSEVLDLQKLLNSDPDTQIAPNGVGSPGNETNFFGNLTKKAVEKFQVKYSIAGPGDSGYGFVGPKTRAKLNEVRGGAVVASVAAPTPSVSSSLAGGAFTRPLDLGDKNSEVLDLQKLLNSDPDTRIAPNGVGSPGNETNFFGNLTKKAVEKFQVKYSIAGPGDSGYGFVGPKTRAKLNEVRGLPEQVAPVATDASAQTSSDAAAQAQLDLLQKQVAELLEQLNAAQ